RPVEERAEADVALQEEVRVARRGLREGAVAPEAHRVERAEPRHEARREVDVARRRVEELRAAEEAGLRLDHAVVHEVGEDGEELPEERRAEESEERVEAPVLRGERLVAP